MKADYFVQAQVMVERWHRPWETLIGAWTNRRGTDPGLQEMRFKLTKGGSFLYIVAKILSLQFGQKEGFA